VPWKSCSRTSQNSTFVKDYYLQNRPMVANANVLGLSCTNVEAIRPEYYTNVIQAQVRTWLNDNPTERPQYVILIPDIPSQVTTNNETYSCADFDFSNIGRRTPSVQYRLHTTAFATWTPFVTSINIATTNDCSRPPWKGLPNWNKVAGSWWEVLNARTLKV
jgi:hypothetical protein